MNEQLKQHLPKLEELAADVKDLVWDGDEAKLREEAGRLALSVLVLMRILQTQQRPSEP
ncbi:hypothetical protein JOE48_006151 [Methylobacterium sp. PvR107]|nr:hypothetical protein [Methylobacterium sp. PvR107]